MTRNVLVTGGAGFIGSYLTEQLLADGCQVTVIDDESTGRFANLDAVKSHAQLHVLRGSAGNLSLLEEVLPKVDEVYHLAAAVGVALIAREPIQTIERNIFPTHQLLAKLLELHQAGRTIKMFLASTSEVYGKNPKSIWNEEDDLVFGSTTKPRWSYGVSKAVDEFLALAHHRANGLPIVVGRFFNVVGPRQTGAYGMVLPRFVDAAMMGRSLQVHDDGQQTRCFAHVRDVVSAVLRLMRTPEATGRVFNIGSDQPVSILELAKRVIARARSESSVEFVSYAKAYDEDFEDIRRRVPDLRRLRTTIQYEPRFDLDTIIDDCITARRSSR